MKKITTPISLLFLLMCNIGYNQVTSFEAFTPGYDTLQNCGNTLSLGIFSEPEADAEFTIDWGDGNSETWHFSSTTTEYFTHDLFHIYAVPSNSYIATVTCYSTTSGSGVGGLDYTAMYAYTSGNCGFTTARVYDFYYSPADGIGNQYGNLIVPMDFTGADGTVTTLYPLENHTYYGLDLSNTPYTVNVNANWLMTNGFQLTEYGCCYPEAQSDSIIYFDSTGSARYSYYNADDAVYYEGSTGVFYMQCLGFTGDPDYVVQYSGVSNFIAPLETGIVFFNACNMSCSDTSDVTISITCPTDFIPETSGLTNANFVGNVLTYDLVDLAGCVYNEIPFSFSGTTPAGTEICFTIEMIGVNDTDLSNNRDTTCGIVSNSYDPNAKNVNQPLYLDPTVQEEFIYDIHFQNDGNSDAINVVVKDTLSSNLDISTFEVLGSKHPVSTSVNPTTREVTFTFSDIYLSPSSSSLEGSQGLVVYSIQENAGLPVDSEIENTASIYFDFNPPIVTNTTLNINTNLGLGEKTMDGITLYPNPADGIIHFSGATIKSVAIYDLAGKQVLRSSLILANQLSIAGIANGIYQVVIATESGTQTQKLVIKK